ncbi:MFS transporter [Roseicyclus sp. F158]|uniref:MFS transporter n=1 Tax=Tropicimonas omnivorans TaxID=3075590 RepID=A0ABU3DGD5_9RHOB|nr:MFS transporter [Roseicyclus sp. F158]MDT0682212.1 MFS transporter [Roseicyclus sp. F158]
MTPPKSFAPFRTPGYSGYWLTGLAANFGWHIQLVGASWAMTTLGGTPQLVALVQTSVALPIMLFSLPSGAIADALGRRTTVIWAQAFTLVVSTILAVLAFMGMLTPWLLLVFTFLIGSGKALNNPGWQTRVSEIVAKDTLPQAIALNSVGFNITRSVGPAIGGVIVATVGAFAAFFVNAISNLGVLLVALRWEKMNAADRLPPEPVGSAMVAGLRYVIMSPGILLVMLRGTVFNFAAISVMALLPLVARDLLDGGPQVYGILLGAFGVGAIVSAFAASGLRAKMSLEAVVRAGFAVFAVAAALMAVSRSMPLTLFASALAGSSWLVTMSTFNTTVQLSAPRWVLSRCQSIYMTVAFGGNAFGSLFWGYVAGDLGVAAALYVSAAVLIVGIGVGFVFALRELDTYGLDPHRPWTPPQISLDMLPKSGPVITTIRYRIREQDVPRFLGLMAERRRHRFRDGARRWVLSRDMQDPEVWVERYKTATWIETQRHNQRRTVAGARVAEELRELHREGGRPEVHYELARQPVVPGDHAPIGHVDH